MKNLAKNTTTTAEASNAPTVTTNNNTKKKETTNMAHPDEQTATKPTSEQNLVSPTPDEIEAAKKKLESIVCEDEETPYSSAEQFISGFVNVAEFDRARIADIYNVMFNSEFDDGSDLDSIAAAMPMLCEILYFLKTQELFCHKAMDWVKAQAFRLLEEAKKNPQKYAVSPTCVPFRIKWGDCRSGLQHDIETVVSSLPNALSARLLELQEHPYSDKLDATRYEESIASFWRVSIAFNKVWDEICEMFTAGAFDDEIASTKLVAKDSAPRNMPHALVIKRKQHEGRNR